MTIVEAFEKTIPMKELAFSVHLCEHCNLNCAGCNNFSCLADEEYADLDQFGREMDRLSRLSGGVAYRIQLTGGEPLLNPKASEFARVAREAFPIGRISFITNGILLKKQSDKFYDDCLRYDIDIDVTPYPIGIDYYELGRFIENKGLVWKFQNGSDTKQMRKESLNLNPNCPKSPGTHNWLMCYMSNNCIQLHNGKMGCTRIQGIHHFLKAFPEETKRMRLYQEDLIDIYSVKSIDELFEFFSRPFHFCKYCDVDNWDMSVEWKRSTKSIHEWV